MKNKNTKYIKFNLEVAEDLNQKIEQVCSQLDITKIDFLRKGIALMIVAAEAKSNDQMMVVAKDDKIIKEIIGI